MARANCSRPRPSGSTRTPPTCSFISMSLAGVGERRFCSMRWLAQFPHRLCELLSDLVLEHVPAADNDPQSAAPDAIDKRIAGREYPRVEHLIVGLAR